MDVAHGLALMFIGLILSIVCLFVAYYFADKKNKPKKELTSVEKSLREIRGDDTN